jgi:hypothetical protein
VLNHCTNASLDALHPTRSTASQSLASNTRFIPQSNDLLDSEFTCLFRETIRRGNYCNHLATGFHYTNRASE